MEVAFIFLLGYSNPTQTPSRMHNNIDNEIIMYLLKYAQVL